MVFRFDFTSFSSLRGILLVGLYASAILEPDYVYQPNYLNGSAYCSLQITYTYFFFIPIPNFQWVCTNACALGPLGKMPIFDYIVVGSGPAGSAIAYRLAQANSARTVLLIEAGDEPEIEAIAPHLFPFNLNASTTNNHYAEPMANYSLAFKNGTNCNWGRAIGGSTQINAMMYVCGTDDNYNKWAIAANDSSWNYTNILQYIKKHQNVQDLNLNTGACANYHSTSGPIVVTNTGYTNDDFFPIYRTAVTQANYSILNDINCGPPYNGFVNLGMTIKAGERMTSGRGFLVSPIKTYSNFFFLRNGTVSKVLATKDATTGTILVTGVNVVTNISTCTNIVIKASREIILSAGSYGSPQILQRSGIGKAADLATCGINQLKELPVGSNLNDLNELVLVFSNFQALIYR
ncbi:hypothetical protein PVAND_009988 [Polypedilum vanderplanki]|uniref:Glucose-methanol-choline oxidoreductase N-terminal domain-containing protein n=1 Tax=Polypedilum vanderplanki TaxID=319348 RepID=A0A9J6CF98_POLVA|nr:hypothetical protein PVAND_009988 [Polypedilum vanderplanki]